MYKRQGQGDNPTSDFNSIDWSEELQLRTDIDPSGGTNYTTMGTAPINAVPIALYSLNGGDIGPQGPEGPEGPQGLRGEQGIQGPEGPKGDQGAGVTIVSSVSDASQLPTNYGGNIGDMFITQNDGNGHVWNGSSFDNVGRIQGPQGERGPAGPQGNTGSQGQVGATGPQGNPGPRGDTGSQGQRGDTGPQGSVGATGAIGPKGDKPAHIWNGTSLQFENPDGSPGQSINLQGATGQRGATGLQGDPGPTGSQGPRGDQGPQGDRGEKGDKGDQGERGATGPAGSGVWSRNGSSAFYNGGEVGIGVSNPQGDLHVDDVNGSGTAVINVTRTGINSLIGASASGGIFGMGSNHSMNLITNNQSRIHVASNGRVGIGTTNPSTTLDVDGTISSSGITTGSIQLNSLIFPGGSSLTSSSSQITFEGINKDISINAQSANSRLGIGISGTLATATCDIGGNLRIRTMPSGGNVDIQAGNNGNIFRQSSDKRLKKNIRNIGPSLSKLLKMRSVIFDWKDDKDATDQFGFIAQELMEIVPEVVNENPDGFLGVDYSELIPILTQAIQEQQEIITRQATDLQNLSNQNLEIIKRLEKLENN